MKKSFIRLAKKNGLDILSVLVEEKIRKRYSISQEFAILRQRDTKPSEFEEYNEYAELCKKMAKKELEE